jgi:putative ABC transport system substrate-binding protein
MPVVGFLDTRSQDTAGDRLNALRRGLKGTGYVEGENVTIVGGGPRRRLGQRQ